MYFQLDPVASRHECSAYIISFFPYYMIMIVISFALVKFYAFAILYVLIVMQIKLVVVVVAEVADR